MTKSTTKPIPESKATYYVEARQKIYKNSTEIYIPSRPYPKLEEGYELIDPIVGSGKPQPTSEEDKQDRSMRRTRTAIKDLILSNGFELFATFTFRDDRDNPEISKNKMNGWLKRQRKKDKSFQYVVIPEFHKDNVSLHFHALISGYKGQLIRSINPRTNKPLVKKGSQIYDFPNYTLGFSEVRMIGSEEKDRIRAGFYLLKYVSKEIPPFSNKKRYWASRGLNRPITIDNPTHWYEEIMPDKYYESDYGTYLFFDNAKIKEYIDDPDS